MIGSVQEITGRPLQEEIIARKAKIEEAQNRLREKNAEEGLTAPTRATTPNTKCPNMTPEEELAEAIGATVAQVKFIREQLPVVLKKLKKIKDPRQTKKSKHKLQVIFLYVMISFIHHIGSRREMNRELSRSSVSHMLQRFFPELQSIPHQDTLNRVLSQLGADVDQIESALVSLIHKWIRNKKFVRFLHDHYFDIAFDGTQKSVSNEIWDAKMSERTLNAKTDKERKQYFIYVLEANLVFQNGMRIPLMSEFLEYDPKDEANQGKSEAQIKQDCETKAFKRLSHRVKKVFSHLKIRALLDGLYANGPIIAHCNRLKWDYMIVLKDKSLPSVWEEFHPLADMKSENALDKKWKGRKQHFRWVNAIEYDYTIETKEGERLKKTALLNVVVCEESWEEVDKKTGEIMTKKSKHAWLSSQKLSCSNVHQRCNLSARHRWNIEISNLVEKHQGYHYEHMFSYSWYAMKGFHYLMRLAHALNELARYTKKIAEYIKQHGQRGFISFVKAGYRLLAFANCADQIEEALQKPYQVRLI